MLSEFQNYSCRPPLDSNSRTIYPSSQATNLSLYAGQDMAHKNRMNNLNYERCLVYIFVELGKKAGLKHAQLAKLAWPQASDPGKKWRAIRNINVTQPQSLTVSDAASLAAALGKNLSAICLLAETRILEGWDYTKTDSQEAVDGMKERGFRRRQ